MVGGYRYDFVLDVIGCREFSPLIGEHDQRLES